MMGRVLMACIVAAAALGCATSRIVARDLSHPVSASGSLFDASYNICRLDHGLKRVGVFELSVTEWSLLCGVIGGGERDISAELRDSIRASGADGIVNLRVSLKQTPSNYLAMLVPVFPYILRALVEGDLVKHGEGCLADDAASR